jgi:NodT family efflux transporter outer membrane factor (OMF) lipoprotein
MKKLLFISIAVLVWGCNRQQTAVLPTLSLPVDSSLQLPPARVFFPEKSLQALIDTAMRHNPDYLAYQQQLSIAKAQLYAAKRGLLPQLDVYVGAGNRRFGEYTMDGVGNFDTNFSPNIRRDQRMTNPLPDYQLSARASWELDIWGRLNAMRKAAAARYLATEAGIRWQQTQLVSEVAMQYYKLRALFEIQHIVSENARLQEAGLQLVNIKLEAGRSNALAVQQFEAQLARTKALYHQIEMDKINSQALLKLQLGLTELNKLDTLPLSQLDFSSRTYTAVPAAVMQQRPDIQAAQYALEAAGADLKAMQAAFFPQLVLTPEFGLQSFNAGKFLDPASLAWQLVGGITAPVFRQGQLKAGKKQAEAQRLQAFQLYRKTVLQAYTEVFQCLQLANELDKQYNEKQKQVESLQLAVKYATELFAAGFASYLEVVVAQNDVLEAEMERVRVQLERYSNQVALYRATGGGW